MVCLVWYWYPRAPARNTVVLFGSTPPRFPSCSGPDGSTPVPQPDQGRASATSPTSGNGRNARPHSTSMDSSGLGHMRRRRSSSNTRNSRPHSSSMDAPVHPRAANRQSSGRSLLAHRQASARSVGSVSGTSHLRPLNRERSDVSAASIASATTYGAVLCCAVLCCTAGVLLLLHGLIMPRVLGVPVTRVVYQTHLLCDKCWCDVTTATWTAAQLIFFPHTRCVVAA